MAAGTRFDTLTSEIGDAFIRVEFPGRKHSTLTAHRQQEGVDRVLAFFREKLLYLISPSSRTPHPQVFHCGEPAIWGYSTCPATEPAVRLLRISPLVGTPVPAVTSTCSTSGDLVDRRAADLADGLGDAVHAVDVGLAELAAVGVERQPAAELDGAVGDEVRAPRRGRRSRAPRAASARTA